MNNEKQFHPRLSFNQTTIIYMLNKKNTETIAHTHTNIKMENRIYSKLLFSMKDFFRKIYERFGCVNLDIKQTAWYWK